MGRNRDPSALFNHQTFSPRLSPCTLLLAAFLRCVCASGSLTLPAVSPAGQEACLQAPPRSPSHAGEASSCRGRSCSVAFTKQPWHATLPPPAQETDRLQQAGWGAGRRRREGCEPSGAERGGNQLNMSQGKSWLKIHLILQGSREAAGLRASNWDADGWPWPEQGQAALDPGSTGSEPLTLKWWDN